jgi:arginase
VRALTGGDRAGLWVHLDADVLDDAVMPAVDYRLPGGLRPEELRDVLRVLLASGRAVGLTVTIFNPALDPSGAAAGCLTETLVGGLAA